MKTNGIPPYVHAKNGFLSIFALLFTAPVLAQISYASFSNYSLTGIGKELVSMSRSYYSLPVPHTSENNGASPTLLVSPSPENNNPVNVVAYSNKYEVIKNSGFEKEINLEAANLEISLRSTGFTYPTNSRTDAGITEYSSEQVIFYAKALKKYAKENGFDTTYAFISNMAMRCTKKRFFVINLVAMKIEQSGLVSHGRGQGSMFDKQYSNITGSRCTSLGRYKISNKYKGGYGESYKLVGLDSSNKNAYNRSIVLHSMKCIPDIENFMPACVSEGCPAVSTKFLASLRRIIDSRKKPMLLWIFDSNMEELIAKVREPKSETKTIAKQNNSSQDPFLLIYPKLRKKHFAQKWRRIIDAQEYGWCTIIKNKPAAAKSSAVLKQATDQKAMRQFCKSKTRKSFNKLFFSYFSGYQASNHNHRNKNYKQYKRVTLGKVSSTLRNKSIKPRISKNKTA